MNRTTPHHDQLLNLTHTTIEATGARLVRQRSTSRGPSPVRQYASHSVCRAAKAVPWGHLHPSVMPFYSGPLMHFLSGVDSTFFANVEARISSMYKAVAKRRLHVGAEEAEPLEFGQLWRSSDYETITRD